MYNVSIWDVVIFIPLGFFRILRSNPLNWGNYSRRFHLLLHLEEYKIRKDIHQCSLNKVPLTFYEMDKNMLVVKVIPFTKTQSYFNLQTLFMWKIWLFANVTWTSGRTFLEQVSDSADWMYSWGDSFEAEDGQGFLQRMGRWCGWGTNLLENLWRVRHNSFENNQRFSFCLVHLGNINLVSICYQFVKNNRKDFSLLV